MLYLMKVLRNLFGGTHKIASTEIAVKDGRGKAVTLDSLPHGFQYSTEEQWTGRYWLDGKKIYTISFDSTVGNINAQIKSLNIDKWLFHFGFAHSIYNNKFLIPNDYSSEAGYRVHFNPTVSTKQYGIVFGNFYNSSSKVELRIEYTCTNR